MTNRLFSIFIISAFAALSSATADDSMRMYEKDAAKTVFGKDVVVQVARYEEKATEKKADTETKDLSDAPPDSSENIVAKYGDPLQKFEVTPKADAPKPFQAMIEAIKIGDKKLAYQYAVQYTRYLQDLESINSQVVGVQSKAMEKLGVLPENSWADSKEYEQYNYLLETPLSAEEQAKSPDKKIERDAQELLKLAKQGENDLFFKTENATPEVDAAAEKAKARKELAGLLPKTPKGGVDVYFFFDSNNNDAILQGREMQKLFKGIFIEHEVNLVGFDVQGEDPKREEKFRADTGAGYNIISGRDFSRILAVDTTPAVAIVNRQSGKTYVIKGYRSSVYLAEALLMAEEENNV